MDSGSHILTEHELEERYSRDMASVLFSGEVGEGVYRLAYTCSDDWLNHSPRTSASQVLRLPILCGSEDQSHDIHMLSKRPTIQAASLATWLRFLTDLASSLVESALPFRFHILQL